MAFFVNGLKKRACSKVAARNDWCPEPDELGFLIPVAVAVDEAPNRECWSVLKACQGFASFPKRFVCAVQLSQ